jgi:hypothetical protein
MKPEPKAKKVFQVFTMPFGLDNDEPAKEIGGGGEAAKQQAGGERGH